MKRAEIGKMGEDAAASYLRKSGLKIIQRNFKTKLGEIDIIAQDGDEFVFVEVRSGGPGYFTDPAESINARKINKLHSLACIWMMGRKIEQDVFRFDAIIVIFDKTYTSPELRHYKNAF